MAYFNGKKEPPPQVETPVWSCTGENCAGWMRENFTFEETPSCPLCHAEMKKETRTLPQIP
ncbi:cold-shock protein [Salibacterium aidingense]|uniref:cold-shock protein n=1 Tax=Salibacterium aidingense TaxID=384933 RepID=UPI0003FA86B3|nr:cold-shock protein [Salibacterium aidingense]